MRYIMLIYSQETQDGPADQMAVMMAHHRVIEDATKKGILHAAQPLKPSESATTVRVRPQGVLTTDGPFAETKEQLAGYYILECKDLDEAIEWAARIPTSCRGGEGAIEVRPLAELPSMPAQEEVLASDTRNG